MMGLFGRDKDLAERFPVERMALLSGAIAIAFDKAIEKADIDRDAAWNSRFFSGYLLGYPYYLDTIDERFGGAVRKMLFEGLFGPEKGRRLVQASMAHFHAADSQTKLGWGAGAPDGERLFRALEENQDAQGTTHSLTQMIEINSLDVSKQTL